MREGALTAEETAATIYIRRDDDSLRRLHTIRAITIKTQPHCKVIVVVYYTAHTYIIIIYDNNRQLSTDTTIYMHKCRINILYRYIYATVYNIYYNYNKCAVLPIYVIILYI